MPNFNHFLFWKGIFMAPFWSVICWMMALRLRQRYKDQASRDLIISGTCLVVGSFMLVVSNLMLVIHFSNAR
jgi:hypothetical protein